MPFFFNLYFSFTYKRWFIPVKGDGSCCHHGHIHLARAEVRMSTTNIDPKLLEGILRQLELNISTSAIHAMFNAETGGTLSYHQVASLRQSMVIDGNGLTPAERLLTYLQHSDDIRFVAMTAKKDRGSLITIRVSKRQRSAMQECAIDVDPSQDTQDNPKTYAEQVTKALSLKDGETLLLGVAWITVEGKSIVCIA